VLQALKRGFRKAAKEREAGSTGSRKIDDAPLPPPVDKVYLTLELFFPTASYPEEILRELRESVEAWREVVPRDGLELEELV
jgi:hypothetical protein